MDVWFISVVLQGGTPSYLLEVNIFFLETIKNVREGLQSQKIACRDILRTLKTQSQLMQVYDGGYDAHQHCSSQSRGGYQCGDHNFNNLAESSLVEGLEGLADAARVDGTHSIVRPVLRSTALCMAMPR